MARFLPSLALVATLSCGAPEAPPHIVVIVVDTLRADVVGPDATPNILGLAERGVVLGDAFTHAPMTLPAHTSLLSSRLPHETGVVVNGQAVPDDLPLLTEHLAAQGYRCLGAGSMASLWSDEPGAGLERGFERFVRVERDYADGPRTASALAALLDDATVGDEPLFVLAHLADPHEPYRDFADERRSLVVSLDGVELERVDPRRAPHVKARLDLAAGEHELRMIDGAADFVPRSLYVHAGEGDARRRVPVRWREGRRLDATRRLVATFTLEEPTRVELESWVADRPDQVEAARRYPLEVARADAAVGTILDDLAARGILEHAVVLLTSDHGEAFGEHGLNGHSHNLYDELLRVPTVLALPGGERFDRARADLARTELARHVDLAPTLLDLAELAPLAGAVGSSLLDPARGRPVHFAETHRPEADAEQLALTDGRWKLVHRPEEGRFELYDLVRDPGETRDLYGERGADFEGWRSALEARAAAWGGTERVERAELEALGY